MENKDPQFVHQQKLEELWVDDAKEARNDKIMRWGMVIGGILFLTGVLCGSLMLGICGFLVSCIIAAGFVEN